MIFNVEAKDLINLRKFYKRSPKQFARASSNVLNSFAFGTKKENIRIIEKEMTVRNTKFVNGAIMVQKVKSGAGSTQRSEVGSIKRDRFTGWEEQELGTKTKKNRVASTLARGGSDSKQVRPMYRMKSSNSFRTSKGFSGNSRLQRDGVMVRSLRRQKSKKPFMIKKHRKLTPGIYVFRGKKIQSLQTFVNPSKIQPKRVRWMSGGAAAYFKKNQPRDVWRESIKRVMKFKI
jgi:hypothetical protein